VIPRTPVPMYPTISGFILVDFVKEKKNSIERNRYSKSIPLARFYDQEKVKYLEAIFNILNEIDSRLKKLE